MDEIFMFICNLLSLLYTERGARWKMRRKLKQRKWNETRKEHTLDTQLYLLALRRLLSATNIY